MRRLAAVSLFLLAGCGYDGHYRYDCQDPENWEAEECNPPICLVDGTCTENLVGFDPTSVDGETTETSVVAEVTEESVAP